MPHFAVTALGEDRPGIVEAVSEVLLEHGANVEDSQMTILRGRFSMTLIVVVDDDPGLERDLRAVGERLGLDAIALSPLGDAAAGFPEPTHLVTVYGADHPGIVHAAAAALTRVGGNVCDLNTRLGGQGSDGSLYVLMLEAAIDGDRVPELETDLAEMAAAQGVEASVHELERDEL